MCFGRYILEGKTPVPCEDLRKWAEFMEEGPWRVACDDVDGFTVSTVFLGLDYRFAPEGGDKPIVFETLVWREDSPNDRHSAAEARLHQCQWRYPTWLEAERVHGEIVEHLRNVPRRTINEKETDDGRSTGSSGS